MNAIQTSCPWLLRYLAVVLITSKNRRSMLPDLIAIIQEEAHSYTDPVLEFLVALRVNFDFEGAQQKLKGCEAVLRTDYFFSGLHTEDEFVREFLDNARELVFETYCRIHRKIDIGMLAGKLGMTDVEAETWIVELIRNTRLDARIDCAEKQVVMRVNYPSVHQQVIDRTQDLAFRTQMLTKQLERAIADGRGSSKAGKK